MLFNSIAFAVFFVCVFSLYWLARRSYRAQNLLLLCAGYIFYGWWDVRFLVLIVVTTVVAYCCTLSIQKGQLSLAQRVRASLFCIVPTTVFLGLNWGAFDISLPRVLVDWDHLLIGKPIYWWVIAGVIAATMALNLLYPLALRLGAEARRRLFLVSSIVVYLAILGFFKYFNFFVDSFRALAATVFNMRLDVPLLRINDPATI